MPILSSPSKSFFAGLKKPDIRAKNRSMGSSTPESHDARVEDRRVLLGFCVVTSLGLIGVWEFGARYDYFVEGRGWRFELRDSVLTVEIPSDSTRALRPWRSYGRQRPAYRYWRDVALWPDISWQVDSFYHVRHATLPLTGPFMLV